MGIWYATEEDILNSLEAADTSKSRGLIAKFLEPGSRAVEGLLKRRFYPERKTRYFDWPQYTYGPTWEIELGSDVLVSLESLTSGGTAIPNGSVFLRRADGRDEPPYTSIEIDLSTSYAFQSGNTFQRAIAVEGVFGYAPTDTSEAVATLTAGISSSDTLLTLTPAVDSFSDAVGVGSLVLIGTEYLVLTGRRSVSFGQTLQTDITDKQSAEELEVGSGSAFTLGETISINSERMRIDWISGNTLTVTRAHDGSTLAEHTAGTDIFAGRQFRARRASLGTDAAIHSGGASVYVHSYPGPVTALAIAETVVLLEQNASAYARIVGSGPSARESSGQGLESIRNMALDTMGRPNRSTAV
jgi:hypothetical protein